MPRIYAPNEAHAMDWGEIDFIAGVAAVPAGTAVTWFQDAGYTIDNSKHVLTLLDHLTPEQLRQLCAYIGLAIDQGEDPDTKYALIRAIEGEISSKYLTTLTITSTAGTEVGDTHIAVTDPGSYAYKYKTGKTTAPSLLYMDEPDATWLPLTTPAGVDITPPEATPAHDKITVVRLNAAGYVIGLGSANITVKAGG